MSIPPYKRVSSSNVTGDWAKDSELVTGVVGRFMSDTQEGLAGGLQMGQNVTAEYKTVTIITPPSDWTTIALLNSFTSTTASSNGFANPRWRYAYDGIQLSGGFELAGVPGVPIQIGQLPAGLVDFNEDSIVWLETSTPSSGAGLIRLDKTGSLTLRAALGGGNLTFCSLDNVLFAAPLVAQPQTMTPLSCFPIAYMTSLPGGQARQVEVVRVLDTARQTPLSVWEPAWYCDGQGHIVVTDMKGLSLGRQYQVTFRAMP